MKYIIYDNMAGVELLELGESLDFCKWSDDLSDDVNGDIFYHIAPQLFDTVEEAKTTKEQLIEWTKERFREENDEDIDYDYYIEFVIYEVKPATIYWLGYPVDDNE